MKLPPAKLSVPRELFYRSIENPVSAVWPGVEPVPKAARAFLRRGRHA